MHKYLWSWNDFERVKDKRDNHSDLCKIWNFLNLGSLKLTRNLASSSSLSSMGKFKNTLS